MQTVGKLKQLLEQLPDDAIILQAGYDHSLEPVQFSIGTALQESRNQYCEDFGESLTPESEYGTRVVALLVL